MKKMTIKQYKQEIRMNKVSIQEAFDYLSERINKCVSEINRLSEIVNSAESVKISISDVKSQPKQERFYYQKITGSSCNIFDRYGIINLEYFYDCEESEEICKALNAMAKG